MRVALDTNRITDLFRGDLELAEQLSTAEEVWIPLFALGEIKAWSQGGTQQRRNESLLNRLLAKPTVGVLLPSRETAEHYARLFVQLRRAGALFRTTIFGSQLWCSNTTSFSSRETGTSSEYRKSSGPNRSDLMSGLRNEYTRPSEFARPEADLSFLIGPTMPPRTLYRANVRVADDTLRKRHVPITDSSRNRAIRTALLASIPRQNSANLPKCITPCATQLPLLIGF